MAYESNNRQRRNHHHHHHNQVYEWSPSNDYQEYEYEAMEEPEVRKSYYNYKPRVHHQVGLKSNMEGEVAEVEASSLAETERALDRLRHGAHNKNEDVDQEADTFIKLEHRRIYLTKLMSMRPF